ncbi:peroxiredoxin [Bacteroidetes bacterium endosymbiont of Geopemphigus sp.]|uniref:peroxiredoxin n=1 Tax=Bacteroidetes bacterium endosymbiont of Geopemphigus sp. TaxID=2047937 RepID=UPI000CD2573C|nr:peroxiredoxin [Bacteroidetes bacterium endosymbiont of Geopemphigus sp.]
MVSLVGRKAPDFKASAVIEGHKVVRDFALEQFKGKKYVLLFFYPKDFTFVCPTELHAFQEGLKDFESRNVQLIAASTDTEQSHWGWLQVPKDKGGIKGVTYPLIADTNKTISHDYGVLAGEWFYNESDQLEAHGELIAYRGLFLIDKGGVVRHQLINDLPLGRSVEEALRVVDALQYFETHGEVCPANWQKGKKGMKADHSGVADYLANH